MLASSPAGLGASGKPRSIIAARPSCPVASPHYVLQLAAALDTIGADDPHVFEWAAALARSC